VIHNSLLFSFPLLLNLLSTLTSILFLTSLYSLRFPVTTFFHKLILIKSRLIIMLCCRAGPIPILSIGYRPILQAFRYVPIPKNFQILLSEKYLNLIEQAASRKAPTLVFQENWLDNNLLTCYTYSGVFSGVWNLDACWVDLNFVSCDLGLGAN
jgi:hypothetical protein